MTSTVLPPGEDVEDICGKEELVSFSDVSTLYPPNQPVTVKYHLGSRVQTSPFDWIGIFPDQWEDVSRPLAHISLPYSERAQSKVRRKSVTFAAAGVKVLGNHDNSFQFVYVNANRHVLGVSLPFRVKDASQASPCVVEREGEIDPDSECSESPVFLSSSSEDDGDWDLSRHSSTLRQACQADAAGPEMPGGSSASDLSDIVVLSTSPSQETARLEEQQQQQKQQQLTGELRLADVLDKIWNLGSDGMSGGNGAGKAEETRDQRVPEEKEDLSSGPRAQDMKILFSHLKEKPLVKQATKAKQQINQESEGRADKGISDIQDIQHNSNILLANTWSGDSLLQQLRILELDPTSEKEDNEEKEGLHDKELEREIAGKKVCPKLITEIPETVPISLQSPSTLRKKAKLSTPADAQNAKSPGTLSARLRPTTAASIKKTAKKLKKKTKRDKRLELTKDESEEDEVKEAQLLRRAFIGPSAMQSKTRDCCPDNEPLSGWLVGESDHTTGVKTNLAFDELSTLSAHTLKKQVQHARRQERMKVRPDTAWSARVLGIAGDQGELYEVSLPPTAGEGNTANNQLKPSEDSQLKVLKMKQIKKGKHIKKQKNKEEDRKENTSSVSTGVNAAEDSRSTRDLSGDKIQPEAPTTRRPEENSACSVETKCELAAKEKEASKRRHRRDVKVKAAKKARRGSSSKRRRASQLSCEFQYLFSVDVRGSGYGIEETATGSETSENTRTTRDVPDTLPPAILDTSENGFPALPSQQDNGEANRYPDSQGDYSGEDKEENANKEDAESDPEEDDPRDVYPGDSPVRVGAKGEVLPYVPPYVLDVMDALPPASASPDGRAMVEWRRSLLPHVPKHALPVFHNKYKAKFGRRLELKRSKLRRLTVSRNSGIIDRIRHQLAAPSNLEQVAKNWRKSPWTGESMLKPTGDSILPCEAPVEEDQRDTSLAPPLALPSYASVVKKAIEANDDSKLEKTKDHCRIDTVLPVKEAQSEAGNSSQDTEPCLTVAPVLGCPIQACPPPDQCEDNVNSLATANSYSAGTTEEKAVYRISNYFPKEYTSYTSDEHAKLFPSQLQLVALNSQTPSQSSVNTISGETAATLSWPRPIFLTSSTTAADPGSDQISASSESKGCPPQRYETPSLHMRPSAKAQSKTQAGSPPRKVKQPVPPDGKEKASAPRGTDQLGEADGQKALLDMALTSCLVDNAELRTTVVSLERKVATLTSDKHKLTSRVEDYKQIIDGLHDRLNSAIEDRQARRESRAFRQKQRAEDGEPPCKRPKLENLTIVATHPRSVAENQFPEVQKTESPSLPPPPPPPPTAAAVAPPPLRPQRPPPPTRLNISSVTPTYASPPIGPFFNLFPGNCGENGKLLPETNMMQQQQQQLPQQAVVAPLFHSGYGQDTHQQNPQLQLQQHFQQGNHHVRTTPAPLQNQNFQQKQALQAPNPQCQVFNEAPPPRNQPGQRKKSPPHLPLPTPSGCPVSPPSCFFLPAQQAPHWRKAPPTQHVPGRPSPPFTLSANQQGFPQHPLSPQGPYQQYQLPGWMLPQNNQQMTEPLSDGRRMESSLLSPWNLSPPIPSSWSVNNEPERNSTRYTPVYATAENQNPQWLHRAAQAQMDNFLRPPMNTENSCYPQRDTDSAFQSLFGFFNGNGLPDPYYRGEASQAGPCRKPLSCVQAQASGLIQGRQQAQPPSPPGRYRSDFMRRLMKGETTQSRRQPNPYRLFNQGEATLPPRDSSPNQTSNGLYPFFPYSAPSLAEQNNLLATTLSLTSPTTAVVSPNLTSPQLLPVSTPEASYRNTAAFVELTADGLLEATRGLDMSPVPFSMDGNHGNIDINGNNGSTGCAACKDTLISGKTRLIESKSASHLDSV